MLLDLYILPLLFLCYCNYFLNNTTAAGAATASAFAITTTSLLIITCYNKA